MADHPDLTPARQLALALEPFAGQVYFSPECHAAYADLGFSPSPGFAGQTALPDGAAYFTSRGSVLGQVPGTVVAAAFAVFNPDVVVAAVSFGWTLTDARTIAAARDHGAIAQLERVLGPAPEGADRAAELLIAASSVMRPEGRPLYAGLRALEWPATSLGRAWRAADLLREARGDSHTAAWISRGLDAVQIGLLSEFWWGLPMKTYVRTRAWSEEQLDAAIASLQQQGLVDEAGTGFTPKGRTLRAEIEDATDAQMQPAVDALGAALPELLGLLTPWGAALRASGAYLAAGPSDLS